MNVEKYEGPAELVWEGMNVEKSESVKVGRSASSAELVNPRFALSLRRVTRAGALWAGEEQLGALWASERTRWKSLKVGKSEGGKSCLGEILEFVAEVSACSV